MQEKKYSIKQWAKDDRPREKLLFKGAENLSNSELLAILIHNGTKEKTAVDLAKEILKLGKDNLNELGKLTVKELMKIKGIGKPKPSLLLLPWNWAEGDRHMSIIGKTSSELQQRYCQVSSDQIKRLPPRSICCCFSEPGQ